MHRLLKLVLLLLSLAVVSKAQVVTDNFSGSGALSGNWTSLTVPSGYGTCTRVSGTVQSPTSGKFCTAVYTGTTFTANSYSQLQVVGSLAGGDGPVLMTTGGNGYIYLVTYGVAYLITAGSGVSSIGSCPVGSAGDTVRFSQVSTGNFICADITKGQYDSVSDSTYTSGLIPGVQVINPSGTSDAYTNFQAGPYTTLTATPGFVITSSTGNTISLTGVGTSWTAGTPGSPTFTISGVSASITAQTVTSATTATLTINAGATQGTATITDPSTLNTASIAVHTPTPWYILKTGGNATQCTGHANAAYPGSGSGQACALNHPMWLLQNGISSNVWRSDYYSVDEVYFEDTGPYCLGAGSGSGANPASDCTALTGTNWNSLGFYGCSAGSSCMPVMPSGYSSSLLAGWYGYCYTHGGCHTTLASPRDGNTNLYNPTNETQFVAINGVYTMFYFLDTNYTDFEGFDIGSATTCTKTAISPGQCPGGANTSSFGLIFQNVYTDNGPTNGIFKDLNIHGMANAGIVGYNYNNNGTNCGTQSASTCTTILSYIQYSGNAWAGYDGDAATGTSCQGTANCRGQGTVVWDHQQAFFNGCAENYPNGGYSNTTGLPANGYNYCTDDVAGGSGGPGYGDSLTIGAGLAGFFTVSNSTSSWATQDAYDFLHLADFGITYPIAFYMNNNWAEGPEGNGYKSGGIGNPVQLYSNVAISACDWIMQPTVFPMTLNSSGYNTNLGDYCRQSGTANAPFLISINNGFTTSAIHNSAFGYTWQTDGVLIDIQCVDTCTTSAALVYQDNMIVGFTSPNTAALPKALYFDGTFGQDPFASPGSAIGYNNWYNVLASANPGGTCPQDPTYETHAFCTSPLVNSQSNIYAIVPTLTSGSAVIGKGVTAGPTHDFAGNLFASPPAIGAFEFSSGIVLPPIQLTGKVAFLGNIKLQ